MHRETLLDRLHGKVVRNPWLQRVTAMTRVLLAVGFFFPGLVKVLGIPFTSLGPEDPVGYFFDALYQSGFYYNFIGWGQVIAAVLLLIPWTATMGALVYFPIMLNIAVITPSLHFTGTPVITSLMLLANIYLLCWDYDKLKVLLPRRPHHRATFGAREYLYESLSWGLLGTIGYGAMLALRIGNFHELGGRGALFALVAGALFGVAIAWHLRHAFENATDDNRRGRDSTIYGTPKRRHVAIADTD